jgi:hypothetical protein
LNNTSRWATGKPHPSFCPDGVPNASRKAGVSGIEKVEPSTWKTRCFPSQRCSPSRVAGSAASTTPVSRVCKARSGSRERAWQ